MRQSHPFLKIIVVVLVFIGFAVLLRMGTQSFRESEPRIAPKNSILQLELEGIILNGKRFLQTLRKHSKNENVKAILITVNSPGGVVGPSQEINAEIQRVRQERKIPVVCVSTGLMASGAYYSAVACDKIVVAPGALVGSIGVIMEFANLERLYDWAKIRRFAISTGKYKDSGSDYREMREDEKGLFQSMVNDVYVQFIRAIMDGRKGLLKDEVLESYADGRVFNGEKAVELGFADQVGYYEDALRLTAELAGLGEDYELFQPPKPRRSFWDLSEEERDPINAMSEVAKDLLKLKTMNQPLYLMPGTWD